MIGGDCSVDERGIVTDDAVLDGKVSISGVPKCRKSKAERQRPYLRRGHREGQRLWGSGHRRKCRRGVGHHRQQQAHPKSTPG